jgi:hypothetical protein
MGTLTYIPSGTVKRLHVDRQIASRNRKLGTDDPAITVQYSKGPIKARRVTILGSSEFEQANGTDVKPLSCGARLWVKTRAALEVVV